MESSSGAGLGCVINYPDRSVISEVKIPPQVNLYLTLGETPCLVAMH